MPISSSAATAEKRRLFRTRGNVTTCAEQENSDKTFLTIEPALPVGETTKKIYKRSHSTLSVTTTIRDDASTEALLLQTRSDGSIHLLRTEKEKTKNPDRISLDRRGLTTLPFIDGEPKLRLLSLQHNLINKLDCFKKQGFPSLVFLDIYDNQLDKISCLDLLENLRVLLVGKNRIKKIEGLQNLTKLEVLDLHGNQIFHITGLLTLNELKVLNLAGNQIHTVGTADLQGLVSLQELNLRRNRLKKLLGFGETPQLQKLFLSNNDIQTVEDMSSIAKATNVKELSIDNNPVSLGGDCVSFLVSYLPQLMYLSGMQITEQVRKVAMIWRRNKESSNAAFMDLTSDVCLNIRREEVISNARTNWELIRSQTKCLTAKTSANLLNPTKALKPDCDIILTSLKKADLKILPRAKPLMKSIFPDKQSGLARTASQDTENSQNTTSTSSNEYFRLPPILVPIINKMEKKVDNLSVKDTTASLSSIGPNVDSSVSSLLSSSGSSSTGSNNSSDADSEMDDEDVKIEKPIKEAKVNEIAEVLPELIKDPLPVLESNPSHPEETESNLSVNTTVSNVTIPSSTSGSEINNSKPLKNSRGIKSASINKLSHVKVRTRAATARIKKQSSPADILSEREREQGGDYLIEICGRHLNIYGQGALRFVDKSWNTSKANDVNTVKFNYANFNGITAILSKLKQRFANIDNFIFKETNICCLGQLNALAEVQGLTSLFIYDEGNPVVQKKWQSYAIYRLSHWGLKAINGIEVTEEDIKAANKEYQSLSDLVLWSLPDLLLQPLLTRLHLDINSSDEQSAKKWLMSADPALQSVVCKEALQWKKGAVTQDDLLLRQKAKFHLSMLLDETCSAINKLRMLDKQWPSVLHEMVRNILFDYSQMDSYMKRKMQELK